jgi:hypothetical protein
MKFAEKHAELRNARLEVRPQGSRFSFSRLRCVALASAALTAVAYCILLAASPPEPVPQPFTFDPAASWISTNATNQSTGCYRLDLSIPATVANAWIVVSAHGGFEVLANGKRCAQLVLSRPPRAFQRGLSETGQRLRSSGAVISFFYPQYQWSQNDGAGLPTWVDLTSILRPGHNALCIEVESSDTTPALIVSGEMLLNTGERIPIRSGSEWAAEPVPRTPVQDDWTDAQSNVLDWDHARVLAWNRRFWRLVPADAYQTPFRGQRIRSVTTDSINWVQQDWDLPARPVEAFLRIATDAPFQVWVNGRPGQSLTGAGSVLASGPWFVQSARGGALQVGTDVLPQRLEHQEVIPSLSGHGDENPPHDAPGANPLRPRSNALSPQDNFSKTIGNPAAKLDPHEKAQGGVINSYLTLQRPLATTPPALTCDRRKVEFVAYSITPLLRAGKNTIRIASYKEEPQAVGLSWQPMLAFDGGARLADGGSSSFASGEASRCFSGSPEGGKPVLVRVTVDSPLEPTSLPAKRFLGHAYPDRPWFLLCSAFSCVCAGILLLGAARAPRLARLLEMYQAPFTVLAGWIGAGLLLRSAMLERSDALFWRFPIAPLLLLTSGLVGAALVVVIKVRRKQADLKTPEPRPGNRPSENRERRWQLLAGMAILLCFVVRAWQIDLQPIDDDEYASVQASLAISAKGVPELEQGIWYTRSPLYHYLAGGVAAVSGGNIFSLRLLSVFAACATAMVLWKLGRELTCNRLVPFCALLFFAIHPYLAYTGHNARFYQQQQFFHLLTVYFFLRGFVANSGMRDRYLTVLALLAAVLSQEITVLQLLPFAICFALFAQRRPWAEDVRFLVVAGCALALVALDVAFFKVKCMTALEGVSPNVEATIGWSFDTPMNFLTMFIGYSRVHLVLSAFLLAGLVITLWRRKRAWLCLYLYLFLSVAAANLFITGKSLRFQNELIPIWILLSVYGLVECAKLLFPKRDHFAARTALAGGWVAVAVLSCSPWLLLGSYDQHIPSDSTGALRFVAENRRPEDRLAIAEPAPNAAAVEKEPADYGISIPIYYDYFVRRHGALVDRNGGAQLIGSLDGLQKAFAKNQRLWILVSRKKMTGTKVSWGSPSSRLHLYLHENAHLVFRSYAWSVYLWDRNAGHYSSFSEKPDNWFE